MKKLLLLSIFLLPGCASLCPGVLCASGGGSTVKAPVVEEPSPAPEAKPAPAPAPELPPAPAPLPKVSLEKTCPAKGVYKAVDMSMPFDQYFIDVMKNLGVETIIRYGDYENETIKNKTLKASEVALAKKNGISLAVVFQHNNSSIKSFTPARGKADAERMLYLAANVWGMPKGSAMYAGVDLEAGTQAEQDKIKSYFVEFSKVVRAAGYVPGAYGSGTSLKNLMAAKLIDYAWLANASRWSGSVAFNASKAWVLKQGLPTICGKKEADYNVVAGPFGQWKP